MQISPSKWRKEYLNIIPWSAEQKEVFKQVKEARSNILVSSTAGAGKSTTLIGIIGTLDTKDKIQVIAFNKNIVARLKEDSRIGNNTTISTAHSLCLFYLKKFILPRTIQVESKKYRLHIKKYMSPHKDLIKDSIEASIVNRQLDWEQEEINAYKNKMYNNLIGNLTSILELIQINLYRSVDLNLLLDFAETYNLYLPEAFKFGEIYKTCINDSLEWGKTVGETEGYISFTDMLWLFCINLNKISLYKKDYLLIDECQDLSKAMIKVVEQFYNKGARIIMVGDPNQAIQGFAGADGYCWQSLHDTFNPIELPLYNSFRCPQKHVKIANYLVPYMRTSKPEEGIVKSVNIEYCLNNCKDGEVILSRGKASLVKAYFSLLAKDKKSYIKDSSSLLSTLTGYLGLVFPLEEEKMPVANIERSITRVMDTYINSAGGDKADYLEDIEKCLLMFNKYIIDNTNKKYLSFTEYCSILKDTVSSYNNEGILLSTIHSYKGCEADTVWILNYSQLPLSSSSMLDWQLKQEENLLFVALTRSKNSLYLIN